MCNKLFKASSMKNSIYSTLTEVNQWANYCNHIELTEQEIWKVENLEDNAAQLRVQLAHLSTVVMLLVVT